MSELLIGLSLAYSFFTALILLSLIYSHIHIWLKILMVFSAIIFYTLSYYGWKHVQGWPTETELPTKFLLHSAVIEEPDKELGLKGQIFIWLSNLEGNQLSSHPRAYRLDYAKEVHSKLQQALREMQNGQLQIGEILPAPQLNKHANKTLLKGQDYPGLRFVKLPDPALPEK